MRQKLPIHLDYADDTILTYKCRGALFLSALPLKLIAVVLDF